MLLLLVLTLCLATATSAQDYYNEPVPQSRYTYPRYPAGDDAGRRPVIVQRVPTGVTVQHSPVIIEQRPTAYVASPYGNYHHNRKTNYEVERNHDVSDNFTQTVKVRDVYKTQYVTQLGGYCGGHIAREKNNLCCGNYYYGDVLPTMSCCNQWVYDYRWYGCKNNRITPLYQPQSTFFDFWADGTGRANALGRPRLPGDSRLCGSYVMDGHKDLCCQGYYYPNPSNNFNCCQKACYDRRYYGCNQDTGVRYLLTTHERIIDTETTRNRAETFNTKVTEQIEDQYRHQRPAVAGRLTPRRAPVAQPAPFRFTQQQPQPQPPLQPAPQPAPRPAPPAHYNGYYTAAREAPQNTYYWQENRVPREQSRYISDYNY